MHIPNDDVKGDGDYLGEEIGQVLFPWPDSLSTLLSQKANSILFYSADHTGSQ